MSVPPVPAFLTILSLLWIVVWSRKRRTARLPPGPKGLPLLGNLFDSPKKLPWAVYNDWSNQYGSDVLFLDIPRQPTLIINSMTAATELLERRSRNYSDRPYSVMDELTGWDWNLGLMQYGQRWRDARRTFWRFFTQAAVAQYHHIETREVRALLKRAVNFTRGIDTRSVQQTFAAIIFDIMYGVRIRHKDDKYVRLADDAVLGLSESRIPGRFWVELLPILRHIPPWIPGSSARKLGAKVKPLAQATRNEAYDDVVNAMAQGVARPSVARQLIEEIQDSTDSQEIRTALDGIARDVTGLGYAAATGTQTVLVCSFLLAMSTAPELQERAHEELDRVVGPHRLPTMEDVESLPFVQAVMLESMRLYPVLPLAVPHAVIEDDEYNGYFIPGGSTVLANSWAILRDPVSYPGDPDTFRPDRFLKDGRIDPDVPSPQAFFGFGRRICAGRHLANSTLPLLFASILHVFDIEPLSAEDKEQRYTTGLLSSPESVPCKLKLKRPELADLLQGDEEP